jgi:exonuclease VII small subunit
LLSREKSAGSSADWRATSCAANVFSEQMVVDTPLKTEFYKHLPGILTGIGIIGTFSGLIAALSQFEITADPEIVRKSLYGLIQGVGHAFIVSAAAITLAMLFTWIEKFLVTRCYRRLEELCQSIDRLFTPGVGEEYLSRLVAASETNAHESAQLRREMVGELRNAMQCLMAEQRSQAILDQEILGQKIGQAVAKAVSETLQPPMTSISSALERMSQTQGDALGKSLDSILQRYEGSLSGSIGTGQQRMENLLAKNAKAFESAIGELMKMVHHMENVGQRGIDSASNRLNNAGEGVAQAAQAFNQTSHDMASAAQSMSAAAAAVQLIMAEQAESRRDIAQMLQDMASVVENGRREAAITQGLIGRMEAAANTFTQGSQRAETYLAQVSQVLTEAHAAFANNLTHTLGHANQQFQFEVTGAVEALRGAIEELSDALEVIGPNA